MVFHAITCQEEVVGMMIMMMRAITMTMKEGHTEQMQQQQGKALMFFSVVQRVVLLVFCFASCKNLY